MASPLDNQLLARLPADDFTALNNHFRTVELQQGESLAIGVRRSSVTTVASRLQTEGLISYSRGHIRIENVERLKELACECHKAEQQNYERLFGTSPFHSN